MSIPDYFTLFNQSNISVGTNRFHTVSKNLNSKSTFLISYFDFLMIRIVIKIIAKTSCCG